MKIAVFSDLHIDITKGERIMLPVSSLIGQKVEAIVLAGDISNSAQRSADWIDLQIASIEAACGWQIPVIFVPGNHEFYDVPIEAGHRALEFLEEREPNFHFLYAGRNPVVINDVAFIGDTLWTDFGLNGLGEVYSSMQAAQYGMSDFRYIWVDFLAGTPWTPRASQLHHREALAALQDVIAEHHRTNPGGKVVMVSHHGPSYRSVHEEYQTGGWAHLNPAYNSGILDSTNESYNLFFDMHVNLWIHGHVHNSFDYQTEHGCRVVTNPRGYSLDFQVNENEDYSLKIIDL